MSETPEKDATLNELRDYLRGIKSEITTLTERVDDLTSKSGQQATALVEFKNTVLEFYQSVSRDVGSALSRIGLLEGRKGSSPAMPAVVPPIGTNGSGNGAHQ